MDASKEYIDELGAKDATGKNRRRVKFKVAKKVNQRKSKFMGCTCRLKYYNGASLPTSSNIEDFIPSIPCHAIFVFLDPILIGVMQVEYQNKEESPFEKHPLQKHTFLTAICIYGALLGINIHTKIRSGYLQKILSYGLLLSGMFSSVSLLSILWHQQLLWFVLIICGSIPLILARHMLISSVCWIKNVLAKLTRGAYKHSSASRSNHICLGV
ncbi:hypothetical protein CR513_17277, partial [Mucuna pruriens]